MKYATDIHCEEIHTKFHKDWFRRQKVNVCVGGGDSQTHRQHGDRISLFLYFFSK
jgi:predicted phosphodiesterase